MIDMAMHMMDIVQNSIRGEAKEIGIYFFEDSRHNKLTFRVEDDGRGMDEPTLKKLTDPFFTTRTSRRVGLGIPFLKMTCEQAGGSLSLFSEEGVGTTVEAFYRTDNPDCLPLGDVAGYAALLLKANWELHIRFSYRTEDAHFVVDSDELKEQGIDLRCPEMLTALKEFIQENLNEIYRKRPPESLLC
ncbi:MAG: ATP-binding protein [Bacteroidia bacterium]|jgi:signal transduction histidine kinase|nr:ATP-binding protein [Bacteroidia bacterium]